MIEETVGENSYKNEVSNEAVLSTNAEEIKVTPNTELILKKYYKDCRTFYNRRS